jgi:hypothetical protein
VHTPRDDERPRPLLQPHPAASPARVQKEEPGGGRVNRARRLVLTWGPALGYAIGAVMIWVEPDDVVTRAVASYTLLYVATLCVIDP